RERLRRWRFPGLLEPGEATEIAHRTCEQVCIDRVGSDACHHGLRRELPEAPRGPGRRGRGWLLQRPGLPLTWIGRRTGADRILTARIVRDPQGTVEELAGATQVRAPEVLSRIEDDRSVGISLLDGLYEGPRPCLERCGIRRRPGGRRVAAL